MIYFIGDTHFGNAGMIKFDGSSFSSADEMDKAIIDNWNNTVTDNDVVFVTGDFGAEGKEIEYLNKLNGIIYLVKGNHDEQDNQYYRECGFVDVYDKPFALEDFYIVSHEPCYVAENMPYCNIHAHVHSNPMYKGVSTRSFCTSACRIGYKPVSFDEIKRRIREECKKVGIYSK